MAEKIKKLARMARRTDKRIRDNFVFPEKSKVLIEVWSKKTMGKHYNGCN
jgi:hypothetical protein